MPSTIDSTRTSGVILSSAGDNPLTITSLGAVAVSTGAAITGNGSQAWTIANAGLVSSGPSSGPPGNPGIILKAGGTVTNTGTITGSGIGVQINSDAGAVTNTATIVGSGIGVALYGGGTVTNLAGGTISGAAFLGVNIVKGDGTVINAGTIIGSSTVNAVLFEGHYNDRLIVDPGAVFVGGRAASGGSGSNTLELAVGNASAGTLSGLGSNYVGFQTTQVDPGANWTLVSSNAVHAASTLELLGGNGAATLPTMQNAPGAAVTNAGYLANAGSILVMGGDNPVGETYAGYGGQLTNTGTLSNTGLLSLAGGNPFYEASRGLWNLSSGVLYNSGTLTNAGTINVAAGSASNSYRMIGGAGARLSDSGVLINTGTLNVYGGNTGLAAARSVTDSFGGLVEISTAGIVTNDGTLNLTAVTPGFEGSTLASAVFAAELLDDGILINNGALLVAGYGSGSNTSTDALLDIGSTGSFTNTGSIIGAGVLRNDGLLSGGGAATGTISVGTLLNDHIIASGTGGGLSIGSAVSADPGKAGLIEIAGGGSLTLNGAIAQSQTVIFEGTTGTLSLGDPMGFAGTIVGLVPGDQLDLTGLPYNAAESPVWANGTLSVSNDTTTINIDVSEDPSGLIEYLPSQDASGGSLLSPAHHPVVITEVGIPGDSPEMVSGTADPNSTISVEIGTITVGTTTANAVGDWTLATPSRLAYGTGMDVIASEQGGGVSQPVLLTYHLPLVINQVGTPGGNPESVSGTADPNSTVAIAIGGEPVGTVTADAAGDWTFAGPTQLVDGTALFVVASEDGLQSAPFPLSYLPLFITQVGTPGAPEAVSGTALPGATVSVSIGGFEIGTTTANAVGAWTVASPSSLVYGIGLEVIASEGSYTSAPVLLTILPLAIKQVGTPGGNPESVSGTADPNSMVTIAIDGEPVGTVTADAAGDWTFAGPTQLVYGTGLSVIASDDGLQSASFPLTYPPFAINQIGTPGGSPESVSGTALPGTTVKITIGGASAGTVTADAVGDWTLAAPTQLVYGTAMRVVATEGDTTSAPVLLTYHNLLDVSQDSINAGAVIIDGTADPVEAVFVTLDGTIVPGAAVADDNGTWSLNLGPVNAGTHAVVATVRDRGAAPSTSSPFDFTALCFCAGARIATPGGTVPVEQLAAGDLVLTHAGAVRPIVWVGVGRVAVTRGRRSAATPVIVCKGALADNVPYRDLRVTKGHCFYFDNALIPVEFLVNHRSILWDDRAREVTLYHIELASHDVLLANGAPAESYRDDGNRWLFRNANSGWGLPPQPPCAPVLTGGPIVDAIWRHLLDRAGRRPGFVLTKDPDLHLQVDGSRLDAVSRHGENYCFRLTARPSVARIVSRAGAPTEFGLARDPRILGVAIRRIGLAAGSRFRVIEASDERLAEGFHAFEADNDFRWTDGDATLPAALFDDVAGPMELVLHVRDTARYIADAGLRIAA